MGAAFLLFMFLLISTVGSTPWVCNTTTFDIEEYATRTFSLPQEGYEEKLNNNTNCELTFKNTPARYFSLVINAFLSQGDSIVITVANSTITYDGPIDINQVLAPGGVEFSIHIITGPNITTSKCSIGSSSVTAQNPSGQQTYVLSATNNSIVMPLANIQTGKAYTFTGTTKLMVFCISDGVEDQINLLRVRIIDGPTINSTLLSVLGATVNSSAFISSGASVTILSSYSFTTNSVLYVTEYEPYQNFPAVFSYSFAIENKPLKRFRFNNGPSSTVICTPISSKFYSSYFYITNVNFSNTDTTLSLYTGSIPKDDKLLTQYEPAKDMMTNFFPQQVLGLCKTFTMVLGTADIEVATDSINAGWNIFREGRRGFIMSPKFAEPGPGGEDFQFSITQNNTNRTSYPFTISPTAVDMSVGATFTVLVQNNDTTKDFNFPSSEPFLNTTNGTSNVTWPTTQLGYNMHIGYTHNGWSSGMLLKFTSACGNIKVSGLLTFTFILQSLLWDSLN